MLATTQSDNDSCPQIELLRGRDGRDGGRLVQLVLRDHQERVFEAMETLLENNFYVGTQNGSRLEKI